MRHRSLFAVALIAAMALSLAAHSASASTRIRFTATEGSLSRVRADTARLTFSDESGTFRIVCEIELTLTLHSSMAKVRATLAGSVTAAAVRSCTGARVRVLTAGLPWHINYQSFTGTLPSISTVTFQVVGVSFLSEAFFGIARCLYGGNVRLTSTGNPITALRWGTELFPLFEEALSGFSCPAGGRFEGTSTLRPSVRMTLDSGGGGERCATPPAARVDEGFQRQEATSATIGMTVEIQCDSTRIDSIRMARANESIGIEDRERAVGRTFRRGERFRYDLRLTAREGTRVVEENVEISFTEVGGSSRGTTRVRFTDL